MGDKEQPCDGCEPFAICPHSLVVNIRPILLELRGRRIVLGFDGFFKKSFPCICNPKSHPIGILILYPCETEMAIDGFVAFLGTLCCAVALFVRVQSIQMCPHLPIYFA